MQDGTVKVRILLGNLGQYRMEVGVAVGQFRAVPQVAEGAGAVAQLAAGQPQNQQGIDIPGLLGDHLPGQLPRIPRATLPELHSGQADRQVVIFGMDRHALPVQRRGAIGFLVSLQSVRQVEDGVGIAGLERQAPLESRDGRLGQALFLVSLADLRAAFDGRGGVVEEVLPKWRRLRGNARDDRRSSPAGPYRWGYRERKRVVGGWA